MKGRERVLQTLEAASDAPSAFLALLESNASSDDPLSLSEFFQGLPGKLQSRAWAAVLSLAHDTVEKMAQSWSEDETREVRGDVLAGVVTLCQCALSLESLVVPPQLLETLQILHDILLSLPAEAYDLQNSISQLCEECWEREVEGREALVPHSVLYVVARTMSDQATQSDLKRVWAMRHSLLLLDFEDSSADSIKQLLLSCLIQPLYLHSETGKKFLSFTFGLHPSFTSDLHQVVRAQLPHCPKEHTEVYGEIYFRAWRLSAGPYLKQLEEQCLQDLMYCAVHAERTGAHSLFTALREVLGYIHRQHHQKGVPEMLTRLYGPFLWRSMKVANALVLANAAALFFDAFPLADPDWTREESDAALQKQFELMTDLLEDTSPMVRCVSSTGVCRVLNYYWELVPAAVVKTLLLRLVRDLAFDASSANVRVAVLQGLCVLMENRLSHPLLQDLLPLLRHHVHDTTEKVRIAFLDLLLLAKGMRSLRVAKICPLEHLLARMEVDSEHVVKRVVALLVDSFQSRNIPPNKQILKCIVLLEMNPAATRRFYHQASSHLSLSSVVGLMLAIHSAVWHCVEQEEKEEEEKKERGEGRRRKREKGKKFNNFVKKAVVNSPPDVTDDATGITQGGWRDGTEESSTGDTSTSDSLSLANRDIIAGLLEVMAILWEGSRDRLSASSHCKMRCTLQGQVADTLVLFFNTFTDGRSRSALYLISSFLPPNAVVPVMEGTLETLSSLHHPTQDYTAMLVALLSWKQTGHVIRLISQWLSAGLGGCGRVGVANIDDEKGRGQKVRRKGKRGGGGERGGGGRGRGGGGGRRGEGGGNNLVSDSSHSMLALDMLNWMMRHPLCYEELKEETQFWKLEETLRKSLDLLENYFSLSSNATAAPVTFDLLLGCLSMYIRLGMHEGAESGWCEGVRGRVEEMRVWGERVLLPLLKGEIKQPQKRQSSRKRKANEPHPPLTSDPRWEGARSVTVMVLEVMTEVVMVGLSNEEIRGDVAAFATSIAETVSAPLLLPTLCKLLFQLTEASTVCEVEGIRTVGDLEEVASLLLPLLSLSSSTASSNPDTFRKVWSQLQPCVSSVVTVCLRFHILSLTPHTLTPLTTLVQVVTSSLIGHLKQHSTTPLVTDVSDLPPFPSAVIQQTCRDEESTGVFLEHLHSFLASSYGDSSLPHSLLAHNSALHIVSALSHNKRADSELTRCVRATLKFVDLIKVEENEKWYVEIEDLIQSLKLLQQRLFQ